MQSVAREDSRVEGIGDEVITGFVFTTIFTAGVVYQLWRTMDITWFVNLWRPGGADDQMPPSQAAVPPRLFQRVLGPDEKCFICLEGLRLPVETNCGHAFCAICLLDWLEGSRSNEVKTSCPVCRSHVYVLLKCFAQPSEDDEQQMRQIRRINQYNRRHSGEPRPWIEHVRDLPLLLRHVFNEFFSLGGLMYMFRLRIFLCFLAALVYLISPLDMIPEAVFGLLGLLDDLFVLVLLGVYMTLIYRRFLAERWTHD
ncbi:E3 ubiquitin-protein ligase RNF170-like isoform X1 [Varroa jacobsoni]|uniref:E3 ubiquitin-protein ligase RNF170 n=1 Tax=Varroa destructor TaxID=109461 RepID=A0A7M7K7K4_VARDE|nr:E3 ubiquitin-protein ligase RNF170-like isoform X2 [Varroa destructor]XP_022693363.1 E3 ubiquitin-protein ligase RNF170-like isoform X1 [Varroa jacobsoni]XP_022693365.1 E3 ubiquitin-protein ligase RNF170-like isoform X1 [Varroa jacobsoni]